MFSSLMTVFLTTPATRKQSWGQRFSTVLICISKGIPDAYLKLERWKYSDSGNSCLLASTKDTNIIGPVKHFDSRTFAGKRRKLAQTKAPEAMMTLLDAALSAGLKAA